MNYCDAYRTDLLRVIESLDVSKVEQAIAWMREARDEDRRIFTCGNGGSASTASHFATDMVKGASYGRATAIQDPCSYRLAFDAYGLRERCRL